MRKSGGRTTHSDKWARWGFWAPPFPPEYGGAGMDLLSAGLVGQAFARWNHALALSWAAHDNLCAHNLARNGSDHLRETYLPGLCSGALVGALGLTEPGAGSDALGSMRTTATRDGNHYVLNGAKLYITNGPVADIVLVYAKPTPTQAIRVFRRSSSNSTMAIVSSSSSSFDQLLQGRPSPTRGGHRSWAIEPEVSITKVSEASGRSSSPRRSRLHADTHEVVVLVEGARAAVDARWPARHPAGSS